MNTGAMKRERPICHGIDTHRNALITVSTSAAIIIMAFKRKLPQWLIGPNHIKIMYRSIRAPKVSNHGNLGPCLRPWRGGGTDHRTTAICRLGLGAKDYEHGTGRGRGDMERGPDSD